MFWGSPRANLFSLLTSVSLRVSRRVCGVQRLAQPSSFNCSANSNWWLPISASLITTMRGFPRSRTWKQKYHRFGNVSLGFVDAPELLDRSPPNRFPLRRDLLPDPLFWKHLQCCPKIGSGWLWLPLGYRLQGQMTRCRSDRLSFCSPSSSIPETGRELHYSTVSPNA